MFTLIWFMFFCSLYMYFKFFSKKILVLLSMELCMIVLIMGFLLHGACFYLSNSFFLMMIFLTFLVIDSVFGLCLLVFSSRNSTFFSNFLFQF